MIQHFGQLLTNATNTALISPTKNIASAAMSNYPNERQHSSIAPWQLELLDDVVPFKKLLKQTTKLYSDVSAIVTQYLVPFSVSSSVLSTIVPASLLKVSSFPPEYTFLQEDEIANFVRLDVAGVSLYSIQHNSNAHNSTLGHWQIVSGLFEVWEIVAQIDQIDSPGKLHKDYLVWQAVVYDDVRNLGFHKANHFSTLKAAYSSLDICSQSSFQVCQSAIETTGEIIVSKPISLAERHKKLKFALRGRK